VSSSLPAIFWESCWHLQKSHPLSRRTLQGRACLCITLLPGRSAVRRHVISIACIYIHARPQPVDISPIIALTMRSQGRGQSRTWSWLPTPALCERLPIAGFAAKLAPDGVVGAVCASAVCCDLPVKGPQEGSFIKKLPKPVVMPP